MTLDELVLEWSYRTQKGYPEIDNPSDVQILKELLTELYLPTDHIFDQFNPDDTDFMHSLDKIRANEPKPEEEPEQTDDITSTGLDLDNDGEIDPPKEGSETYDMVIKKHLVENRGWDPEKPIPTSKHIYPFPGKGGNTFDIRVKPDDLKWWQEFWELTPPKEGETEGGTKGVGNGEVALYWLYNHSKSPVNVLDTRGADNPDLEFNGVGVEVKAFKSHVGKKSLGRFGQDREQLKMLGIIFGINALTTIFKGIPEGKKKGPKDVNPLTWDGKNLVEAFEEILKLQTVDFSQLAEIYEIFSQIETNLEFLDNRLGKYETADEGARSMAIEFVRPKIQRKPGQGGYLANLLKNGDCRFWAIDFSKIKTTPDALNHIKTSQGSMALDFDAIFGKTSE